MLVLVVVWAVVDVVELGVGAFVAAVVVMMMSLLFITVVLRFGLTSTLLGSS